MLTLSVGARIAECWPYVVHVKEMSRPDSHLVEERTALGTLSGAEAEGELTSRLADPGPDGRAPTIPPPLPPTKTSPKAHLILVSAQATEDVIAERPTGTFDDLRPPRPAGDGKRGPHFGPRTLADEGAALAAELPSERPRRDLTRPKAVLPGIALPPPTEYDLLGLDTRAGILAKDESSYHQLRRDESVIAAAYAARSSPMARAKSFWARTRSSLQDGSQSLTSVLGETGLSALQRFEQLPRKSQLLLVAAPYAGALILALVLFQLRGKAEATEALPTPAAPVPAAVVATVAPVSLNTKVAEPEPAIVSPPKVTPMHGVKRVLLDKAILLGRPDTEGPQVVKLRPGTSLSTYPEFPAPAGWILVQSEKGTVGFLEQAAFDRSPAPKAAAPAKAKKKLRRR